MYLFLYGEDSFRSRQKLEQIKQKYQEKVGSSLNLIVKEGIELEPENFLADLTTIPFLASTRLIIVQNPFGAPAELQRKIAGALPKTPDSTVLVFWQQGLPDERTVLFKALNQPGQSERFNLLKNERLLDWLYGSVEEKGGKIEKPAAELLKEAIGSDLWRMSSEVEKLLSFTGGKIDEGAVKTLVVSDLKINAFDMIDHLVAGNFKQALRELSELLASEEEPLKILGALVYQIRQLILVRSLPPRFSPREISRRLKISPFAVYRCLRALRRIGLEELSKMHEELLKADIALKTGIIEPRLGLWFLVFNLTDPAIKIKY